MTVQAITPSEVDQAKADALPDFVLEIFNNLIVLNWNGHSARITKTEAVDALLAAAPDGTTTIDMNWLDVEPIYRKAGWEVNYDKPGYNETYEGSYTFKKKGK